MPPTIRKAIINPPFAANWVNRHFTVQQDCKRYYSIKRPQPQSVSLIIEDMKACAIAMQSIFADAVAQGQRLRCIGGGWSLSDAAVTDGWLLDTLALNLVWTMQQNQVDIKYKHINDFGRLWFSQCGVTVQKLNDLMETHGWSMTTSGASNGQTIAGAVSTGTHGSAYQFGAMTEFVVGIHIVVDPNRVVYLERDSYPVVSQAFATELGAELVRDDELFNAALVSFGSFGMIAGLMLEAEPLYMFETSRVRIKQALLRNAMDTLKLDNLGLLPAGKTPWHFEVTFNPHDSLGDGYVRTLYKMDFVNHPKPVSPPGKLQSGEGLLGIIGTLGNVLSANKVAAALNLLMQGNLQLINAVKGTSGEIFSSTFLEGKAMSMELGIDMKDSSKVLDIMLNLHPEVDVYLGVISYRWVKQSTAMLGFTKFSITATIEFNAAPNNRTLNFYNRLWNELEVQNIPYTLHWGQMNNFTPQRIKKMYGTAVDKWMACRNKLMTPAGKAVFTSKFLQSTGLG